MSYRVLVTGSAGAIGQSVCAELKTRGHWVRGLDLLPTPGVDDSHTGDIADAAVVHRAFDSVDTVVHLAAYPNPADFLEKLLQPNFIGLYHILNEAEARKVRRVVLASSSQVVSGQNRPNHCIGIHDEPRPHNLYAASKVFMEAAAQVYAHRNPDISWIVIRPAWMPRTRQKFDEALERLGEAFKRWYLSPDDVGRVFACAVEADAAVQHAVLFAVSKLDDPAFDIEPTRRLIGYEPQDHFGEGFPRPRNGPHPRARE